MSKFKKHLIGDVHLTKDLTLLLLIGGLIFFEYCSLKYICEYLFMEANR